MKDINIQLFYNNALESIEIEYLKDFLVYTKENIIKLKTQKDELKNNRLGQNNIIDNFEEATYETFIFLLYRFFESETHKYLKIFINTEFNDQELLKELKKRIDIEDKSLNWNFINNLKSLRNAITHNNSIYSNLSLKKKQQIDNLIKSAGTDKIKINQKTKIVLTYNFCEFAMSLVENFFNVIYEQSFNKYPGDYKIMRLAELLTK